MGEGHPEPASEDEARRLARLSEVARAQLREALDAEKQIILAELREELRHEMLRFMEQARKPPSRECLLWI